MIQSTRAVGIVIQDFRVLLMFRKSLGKEYWTFPGGGVESNESIEDAVIRELAEETSLTVNIKQLLYIHTYQTSQQYFYLCESASGTPKLAANSEELAEITIDNVFEPRWMPIEQMKDLLLYPLEIRDWLIEDIQQGFTSTYPKEAVLNEDELRQTL